LTKKGEVWVLTSGSGHRGVSGVGASRLPGGEDVFLRHRSTTHTNLGRGKKRSGSRKDKEKNRNAMG